MTGVLGFVVGGQVLLLLAVSVLLIAHRWLAGAGQAARERERARLSETLLGLLAGRVQGTDFLRMVDAARPDAVAAVMQRHGAQINGEDWETVVRLIRRTRWFAAAVTESVHSPWWWRRLVGARMLGVLANEQDLSAVRRLTTDRHPAVKVAAIAVLRRIHTPDLVASVLDEALGAPSVVRHYFFDTLLAVGPALVPTLHDRLRRPQDPRDLPALVRLAGDVGAPELLDAILPHVADLELEVRAQAARALGNYPHPAASDALRRLLTDADWQVRARAASALGSIRALEAREALDARLRDANWWVRLRAAVALRRLGPLGLSLLEAACQTGDRFAAEMASYTLGLTEAAVADYAG